jgi:cell division protein ZapA (FtsZ GTPase activity inhibitor)
MDVIANKNDKELLDSLVAEIAKASNEIKCARGDIDKAQNRIKFAILLAHELINRQEI